MTRIIFATLAIILSFTTLRAQSPTADKAEELHRQAEAVMEESPYAARALAADALANVKEATSPLAADIRSTLGNALLMTDDVDGAIREFGEAARIARICNDEKRLGSALTDAGVAYRLSGQLDSALSCYTQALAICERHEADNPGDLAHVLTSLAIFYYNQGRFDDAVPYIERAVGMADRSADSDEIIYARSSAGLMLFNTGRRDEGLAMVRGIIDYAVKVGKPRYTLKTLPTIINMHQALGQADSVDYYMAMGEKLLTEVPAESVEACGFMEEKMIVLNRRGDFAASNEVADRILRIKASPTPTHNLYLWKARNLEALHRSTDAVAAYERSIALLDSMRRSEIDTRMSEFAVQYDSASKEAAIARLEADRRLTWLVIVALVLALTLLVGAIVWTRRRAALRTLQAKLDGIDEERRRLAKELHDGVCNDLLGIGLMLQTQKADKESVVDMIEKTRSGVRHITHLLMPPQVGELRFETLIGSLLQQFAQVTPEIDYQLANDDNAAAELPAMMSHALYRVVQEYISNLIQHEKGLTFVRVEIADKQISITHDGEAIAAEGNNRTEKAAGIGRRTIAERLESVGATSESEANRFIIKL